MEGVERKMSARDLKNTAKVEFDREMAPSFLKIHLLEGEGVGRE